MSILQYPASMLEEAWQVRWEHFPLEVEFTYPHLTLAVRSTGIDCPLNCAHCGGHYLKGMVSLTKALLQKDKRYKSFLVSGACNSQGRVPYRDRWTEVCALAERGELNIHPGLVGEEEARQLGQAANTVSFDFVVDAQTIEEVYGLPAAPEDYLQSYRFLRQYSRRVVPHICIGLFGGRIQGEYRALELLKEEGAEAISFIIFRPTVGTALESASPPPLEEVARILTAARISFPKTPIYLGCLRPGGSYREKLDCLALQAGVNKIVQPAPAARCLAEKLGLTVKRGEECCAL